MLRRDPVRQRRGLVQVLHHDHRPIVAPARPRDGPPLQRLQPRLHRRRHRPAKARVIRDQQRLRALVMFGLAHQVERDPVGIVVLVGDHQDFGRPGDHVDPDLAEDPALGRRDKGVAGARDLVHRGNAFGPIGQRRHRLRPADAIDLVHSGDPRGQQHQRIDHAAGSRHADRQPLHPRHLGRNRVHQHGRRIGGQPARHVKPRRRNRTPPPAQGRAVGVGPERVLGHLADVVGADALGGEFQRLALFRGHLLDGRVHLGGRDRQRRRRQVHPVEFGRQLDHRRIAARAHIGNDAGDHCIHIRAVLALGVQQRGEGGLETGLGRVQEDGHGGPLETSPRPSGAGRPSQGGPRRRCRPVGA